uniref:Uncharacterized protein n=1 Tax=Anguilla anguilla TaxID=7936 RepID=A0A0E9UW75_ANGAN
MLKNNTTACMHSTTLKKIMVIYFGRCRPYGFFITSNR